MVVNDLNKKYTSYFYFSHLTRMILHWKHGYNNYVIYLMMNPFVPSAPFLYPPKNIRKAYVFQFSGLERGCIGNKWIQFEKFTLAINFIKKCCKCKYEGCNLWKLVLCNKTKLSQKMNQSCITDSWVLQIYFDIILLWYTAYYILYVLFIVFISSLYIINPWYHNCFGKAFIFSFNNCHHH